MVRLFVCIDLLGVVHTMTRHQKTRPETPEKRPTPDSTTAPETQHHAQHTRRATETARDTQPDQTAPTAREEPEEPHSKPQHHTRDRDTTQPTPCRQRDTLPDAPQAPYSHFNAIKPLYTIKP